MPVATDNASTEVRLRGTALSPGVSVGRPCFFTWHKSSDSPASSAGGDEVQRLRDSLQRVARQRAHLAEETATVLDREHADIFTTQRLMLDDESLQTQLVQAIQDRGCSAQQAVRQVFDSYKALLSASDSGYLRQRVADIDEIRQTILGDLERTVPCRYCRETYNCSIDRCQLGNDHILVGREITASLPVETDAHTTGFIVEKAGPNSHAIILARALLRPVVGNIRNLPDCIPAQARLLIDGTKGQVFINPLPETLAHYQARLHNDSADVQVSTPVTGLRVMANISLSADVREALAAGAEGVGLYRTEMELLAAGRLLSENEQALRYTQVVKAMAGKPVCIRLLDLHHDKNAVWLSNREQSSDDNGKAGKHILLARPELLQAQARALATAAMHGPIHVLYPMIISAKQFLDLRRRFDGAINDMPTVGLQHGVLFEVPAACLAAAEIMAVADFGCIGTNDLIQYLFGADRGGTDTRIHSDFESSSVLWELIAALSHAAASAGKPMAICGELAGKPELTCRILSCGITTISTSTAHVADVRRAAKSRCSEPLPTPA